MAEYWLNNFLTNSTSEEKIQNFYTKYLENFKTFKEFNASHILVKEEDEALQIIEKLKIKSCLLYTSPSPRDVSRSRMPSSA